MRGFVVMAAAVMAAAASAPDAAVPKVTGAALP